MKSEERHHLKENDLEKLLVQVKSLLEKNTNLLIAVAVVLVVVLGGYFWMNRPPSATSAQAAATLLTARSQDDFASVASNRKFAGLPVADWARLKEADLLLQSGSDLLFSDRAGAISDLDKALESYEAILAKSSDDELKELASYGRACTLEAKSEGETEEAIKAFNDFVAQYQGSLLLADAQKRIGRLKKGDVQGLYRWMAKNAGKPVAETKPLDGAVSNPLEKFGVPLESKDAPEKETEKPVGEKPAGEEPVTSKPAPEEKAPGKEPAKPAAEAKPAAAQEKTPPAQPKSAEPAGEKKTGETEAAKPAAEKNAESAKTE